MEPSLNRAVSLAHALKIVEIHKGVSVSLTKEGLRMAEEIGKDGVILEEERKFLFEVAPKITDALMRRVWRMEDLL